MVRAYRGMDIFTITTGKVTKNVITSGNWTAGKKSSRWTKEKPDSLFSERMALLPGKISREDL